jgi:hypothetical protein
MDNYIRYGENFSGISVPQDIAKVMTSIYLKIFGEDIV